MNWLKIILCRLGILDLVWLIDFDGSCFLRIKFKHNLGHYYAYRIWCINVQIRLNEDGSCVGRNYVKSWKPYKK